MREYERQRRGGDGAEAFEEILDFITGLLLLPEALQVLRHFA